MKRHLFSRVASFTLALMVAGCATPHAPAPSQKPASATKVASPPTSTPAPAATPAPVASSVRAEKVTEKVLGAFPTSTAKPAGKPWSVMHKEGFTGGFATACGLLELTKEECTTYQKKHSGGECVTMEVANGVVLDRLTFTQGKQHLVQRQVLVNLQNPPTRTASVCELGKGVVAIRFHGCNNHAVVRAWVEPLVREVEKVVTTPVVASAASPECTEPLYAQLNVWGAKALDMSDVRATVERTKGTPGYFEPDRVSRKYGRMFREEHAAGRLERSKAGHEVYVVILKKGGGEQLIQAKRSVVGEFRFALRADFAEGDVVRVVFTDLSKLVSPVSDIRAAWSEFVKSGCGPTTNLHAIEK